MIGLILNPGSGPVDGASEAHARHNITVFLDDVRERFPNGTFNLDPTPVGESDGRWFFSIVGPDNDTVHEIEMPGLPIEQVRFMRRPDQNIWDFPRLYVDGSSWVWHYALERVGTPAADD